MVTQVRPGGIFDEGYIEPGTIITSVNKQPINTVADIDKAITNLKYGKLLAISGFGPDGTRFNSTYTVE